MIYRLVVVISSFVTIYLLPDVAMPVTHTFDLRILPTRYTTPRTFGFTVAFGWGRCAVAVARTGTLVYYTVRSVGPHTIYADVG